MPGFVDTPLAKNMPFYVKMLWPVFKLASKSIDDCGDFMASALTSAQFKQGGFWLSEKADPLPSSKIHTDEKAREALVAHYTKEVAF